MAIDPISRPVQLQVIMIPKATGNTFLNHPALYPHFIAIDRPLITQRVNRLI